MKTIQQALLDEIHYPISVGFVENVLIKRGLDGDSDFSRYVAMSEAYMGALADCLFSLIHAVNFSEADKSVGSISDSDKERILLRVNSIYKSIDEPLVDISGEPKVYVGW